MAKAQTTEVAVAKQSAMAVAADFMDASDFGGAGFEGTDKDSYAIPFIQILQKMSPLVDEDHARYIQGAKAGMLYNTVTQKLYDGKSGMIIIPCAFKRSYVIWGGRESDSGGFKGELTPEQFEAIEQDETKVKFIDGKPFKPNEDGSVNPKKNDYYADTRSHYVLVVDPETGEVGQAILALSSTQTKSSKMLLTTLQQKKVKVGDALRTPPTFANLVRMTTVSQTNDKGSWSGAKFELEGMVTDRDLYAEAKAFYQAVNSGAAKADFSKGPSEDGGAGEVSGQKQEAEGF